MENDFDITDNYLRARQHDPIDFEPDTFKTIRLSEGVKAIIGRLKGETATTVQSVLFDKKRFDENTGTTWLRRNMMKFTEAVELENKKASLFDGEDTMSFETHLEGHLPALTEAQIHRLLELAGPEEHDDVQEIDDAMLSKYFRRV